MTGSTRVVAQRMSPSGHLQVIARSSAGSGVAFLVALARRRRRLQNGAMSPDTRWVRFGPFVADLSTGELWNEGIPIRLQQQPFKVLKALLESPGELVTRESLRLTLWVDGTHVGFERGLTVAIRKLREALADRADSPRYIETLPGRGYRFIAPVVFEGAQGRHRSAPRRHCRVASAAAALLLGVALNEPSHGPLDRSERLEAALSLSAYACRLKSDGRAQDALAVIRQAHALAPSSARITAEVGFYLHAAGQYEGEMPMLQTALAQDDRSVDAWLHLGLAYARRLDFVDAIAALERAHGLAPSDDRVARWLTWARAQRRPQA
jgi:DNA-binding winged helix-turn-helix (wHTH) protein